MLQPRPVSFDGDQPVEYRRLPLTAVNAEIRPNASLSALHQKFQKRRMIHERRILAASIVGRT